MQDESASPCKRQRLNAGQERFTKYWQLKESTIA